MTTTEREDLGMPKFKRHIATVPSPCAKKWAFPTKRDAKAFIRKRRGTPRFSAKHVYLCPNGRDHYHLTENPQDGSLS